VHGYFLLSPSVHGRVTHCYGGSQALPQDVGTADCFDVVLAHLLESVEATGFGFGPEPTSVHDFIVHLVFRTSPPAHNGRSLDYWIETEIHGEIVPE